MSASVKCRRFLGVLVVVFLMGTGLAQAALTVTFTQQADNVTIGQEGTWIVTVTNTDSTAVTGATLVVGAIPTDFTVTDTGGGTFASPTLTWSGLTIPASGSVSQTFKISPNCAAGTGKQLTASVNASTPVKSNQIAVGLPIINLTLLDGSNNSVVTAQMGNTVTWLLKVENTGTGDLITGADLNFTLGGHFGFTSISGPNAPASLTPGVAKAWNSGTVAKGTSATYTIVTTVNGCDRVQLVNSVTMNYKVGSTNCLADRFTSSSIALDIREPVVIITPTTVPNPVLYCPAGSDMTIEIKNTGVGPANNFMLKVPNWPSDWKASNVTGSGSPLPDPAYDAISKTLTFTVPNVNGGGATLPLKFNVPVLYPGLY